MSNIYVSRPLLPKFDEYTLLIRSIWENNILTNNGPLLQRFERELSMYLGLENISVVANGMLGLTTVLQAMDLKGEVITSPYSFVATTHSILMSGLKPVFVDISPSDFNIDCSLIEGAITDETCAIMAVHCYGNPCAVEEIERIAQRYGLKIIYDAAHAFNVSTSAGSLLREGDASVLSFHATKVMNTFEGGAIVSRDSAIKDAVNIARNFGITDEDNIPFVGANAKMSELHAAAGILQLRTVADAIAERREISDYYTSELAEINGIDVIEPDASVIRNYSYFPIIVRDDFVVDRDTLYKSMKSNGIFARKYFYPLLSNLPMYKDLPSAASGLLPVAQYASAHVLCLPIYPGLKRSDQDRVLNVITGIK